MRALSGLLLVCCRCAAGQAAKVFVRDNPGWGSQCEPQQFRLAPAVASSSGGGVRPPTSQCGEAETHAYTICSNTADRQQLKTEVDVCECARRCLADPACQVMSFQEDPDHTDAERLRTGAPWKYTRCFLYRTCIGGKYTPSSNSPIKKWCMAIGVVTLAPSSHAGWVFSAVVLLGGGAYVLLGVAMAGRQGGSSGSAGGGGGSGIRSHPHYSHWLMVAALCADGLAFARGTRRRGGLATLRAPLAVRQQEQDV
eukprot:COSAG01_NODE_21166_length_915_cov_1.062500_1_plen_253_part_01